MSKTKKAVIIGSVLVGIGVIIGFIGIAIGGFKFPNGAVDLTTMKALHAEKKTVQIADAFDKIEIAGASSMDIEICKSKTGKNYVEYYDTDDWIARWIAKPLKGRSRRVLAHETESSWLLVSSGVPWG